MASAGLGDHGVKGVLEAYGIDLLNSIGLNLIEHLESIEGILDIQVSSTKSVSKTEITRWEKDNFPYRLPVDLKGLLLASNGISVKWHVNQGDRNILIGNVKLNKLSEIERAPIDDQEELENAFAAADSTYVQTGTRSFAAFVLDKCEDVGKVVLLYIPGHPSSKRSSIVSVPSDTDIFPSTMMSPAQANSNVNSYLDCCQVWFQDMACQWHFLTESFVNYFRLMVVHLGILGWQYVFTDVGLPPITQQWMRMFCPERLALDLQLRAHLHPQHHSLGDGFSMPRGSGYRDSVSNSTVNPDDLVRENKPKGRSKSSPKLSRKASKGASSNYQRKTVSSLLK
mmetsp:Transcript_596/g.764  ORF Transcript_596/g.764 Transcript_596/m.764 type:complete len:340 (-) Transcript_596:458-1477(-)